VTDGGLGLGYADRPVEEPVVHGESRVTESGFGLYRPGEGEQAPASQGESRVTDPGFSPERVVGMAASNPAAHGESRVTDGGFNGAVTGEFVPAAHGESRVTDGGFNGAMHGESTPAAHGESRVTDAGLGLGYADRRSIIITTDIPHTTDGISIPAYPFKIFIFPSLLKFDVMRFGFHGPSYLLFQNKLFH
jgi:hypothetical protein